MKTVKQLLLTFDYELFFGNKCGTVENCMLRPTNMIGEILDRHGVKSVFFVDAMHLVRLEEAAATFPAAATDLELIMKQLQQLAASGHYIFFHLHPHWVDAVYLPDTNGWEFPTLEHFSFTNLDEQAKREVFSRSFSVLNRVVAYEASGYRAGGLYVQPFSEISPYFEEYGIRFEFSVLRDFSSDHGTYKFDYTSVPEEIIYRFSDDVTKKADGAFTEFSINYLTMNLTEKIMHSLWYRSVYKRLKNTSRMGDGSGSGNRLNFNAKGIAAKSSETFSLELMNAMKNSVYLRHLKQNPFLHFISHPKLVSMHHLDAFDRFLSKASQKYTLVTDFREMMPVG